MIECIFTLDYEIYGNGTGSLNELVYEPTERLRLVFEKRGVRFVSFVEVAEFEMIETAGTDAAIGRVKQQVKDMHRSGHEIALHLHPQWYNAHFEQGCWRLDYSEYNLCILSQARIAEIVNRSVTYLGRVIDKPQFSPLSFRAGNWLFQPTRIVARELFRRGMRIDSSVFKGGLQRAHHLDYRPAMRNGYYWPFSSDVNQPDSSGRWLEVPIYTEMVPFWKMPTSKRLGFIKNLGIAGQSTGRKLNRVLDFSRFRHPLKFDFCRMTFEELTSMLDGLIREDRKTPTTYKPIVAIGHTKDLTDTQTIERFLAHLQTQGIGVTTFESIYSKLKKEESTLCATPA
jgi:hypothetical protein